MNTMIQHNKFDISVVIPIYNEEKIIPELYERLTNTVSQLTNSYELIFLNDGSRDHSLLELIRLSEEDSNVFFINFSRNCSTDLFSNYYINISNLSHQIHCILKV